MRILILQNKLLRKVRKRFLENKNKISDSEEESEEDKEMGVDPNTIAKTICYPLRYFHYKKSKIK